METSFQVLEVATVVTWRDLQTTMDDGTSKGWGKLVDIPENKDQFGLGYEPSKATLKGKACFPPIQETFVSKGTEHGGHVAMISSKINTKRATNFIREGALREELKG